MTSIHDIGTWLNDRLALLIDEHDVPGASVAVLHDGHVVSAAAGVLSQATGVEATVDSVFQIGSITKLWTSTLIMQLVDEGLIDLDTPVIEYLSELAVIGTPESAAVTARQLLSHTSGLDGDVFTDTGPGDDCIERYIATLGGLAQLFAPGEMFSYSNTAFCVLGRLVEVMRGRPFDVCLRTHLIDPLGLKHAASGPYEAILHRAAVGHLEVSPGGGQQPTTRWALPRSTAGAGAHLAMSAEDLLAFVTMHLEGGVAADGRRLLDVASVEAMQRREVELPYLGFMGNAWGLGWGIYDWPGGVVLGHDGGTIGQSAFLRVVPEQGLAVTLLVNGGDPFGVYREVFERVLRELGGITVPILPSPPTDPVDIPADRYVGTYQSELLVTEVSQDETGAVWAEQSPRGIAAEMGGATVRTQLVGLDGDTLIGVEQRHGMYAPFAFVGDDGSGRAAYLHTGRADRRVEPV